MAKRVSVMRKNNNDYSVTTDIRNILEKGISNKIFLTDETIRQHWYSYYLEVKYIELMLQFSPKNGGSLTASQAEELTKAFEDKYYVFINFMNKKLDHLEENFQKNNYISDYTDTVNLK